MTVLGEFVLPHGAPAWTSSLVDVLAMFGVEEKSARQALARLGQAMSFVATYGALGEEGSMVAAAWDLNEVGARYERFIEESGRLEPGTPNAVLQAQIKLVHEWRRFPFLDPQLPAVLLPAQWSGTRATELFNDRHGKWRDGAQARWLELS